MPESRPTPRSRHGALRWLAPLLLALASLPVAAHKLQVFAFAEGARIAGTVYFAGGARARGAHILVRDVAGRTLAELAPGADGSFSYLALAAVDHLIVAESGDGHRAEWRVTASELAGGFPATDGALIVSSAPVPASLPALNATQPPLRTAATGVDPALVAAIDQAVARQVRPLREQLIAAQNEIRLRDILGGIGYILGLAGLALWWRRPDLRR